MGERRECQREHEASMVEIGNLRAEIERLRASWAWLGWLVAGFMSGIGTLLALMRAGVVAMLP